MPSDFVIMLLAPETRGDAHGLAKLISNLLQLIDKIEGGEDV